MKADHTRWCSSKEYPLSVKLETILNEYDRDAINSIDPYGKGLVYVIFDEECL